MEDYAIDFKEGGREAIEEEGRTIDTKKGEGRVMSWEEVC